jgi:HEPN domain-containing protein
MKNISKLVIFVVENIEANNITIPPDVMDAVILSEYAVSARYPVDYEPVGEEEFLRALEIARSVFTWVSELIKGK